MNGTDVAPHAPVFLIRHAEKGSGGDPDLTPTGRARAQAWGEMLAHTGITAVYTSEAKRTKQTGRLIADRVGVEANEMPGFPVTALLARLIEDHAVTPALVVGHSNTVPMVIEGLGATNGFVIEEEDFANLFIVDRPGEHARAVHLRMPRFTPL